MQTGSSLFYVALVTEGALADEIHAFKEEMAQQYACRAAMKSPPHITLIPPFFYAKTLEKILYTTFDQLECPTGELHIPLNGFGYFRRNVIFVQPQPNEKLSRLQACCLQHFMGLIGDKLQNIHPFHPHITIANRDLRSEDFDAAWAQFASRTFVADWKCQKISLLRHNGRFWEIVKQKPL